MKLNDPVYSKLPPSVQKLILRLQKDLSPTKIILFGSRARGDHRDNSDFDFAVEFPKNFAQKFQQILLDLESEPITLFKIDLLESNKLAQDYKSNILKDGKIVYG